MLIQDAFEEPEKDQMIKRSYSFYSLFDWRHCLFEACIHFRTETATSPFCLLIGAETIEAISVQPGHNNWYTKRDALDRITFIIFDNFALDVLISNLPDNEFILIDDPRDTQDQDYYRILLASINSLYCTRNSLLEHIKSLSLTGEMADVYQMLQANGIEVGNFTLGDFKNVEDKNVQHLLELWHAIDNKIELLEP